MAKLPEQPNGLPSGTGGGRERLRILVECIVRSGVKLIPFAGSAVDQATFGIKDALAQAETKKMLQTLCQEMQTLTDETGVELQASELDGLLSALMDRPSIQALLAQLDDANAKQLKAISELSQVLGKQGNELGDLREKLDTTFSAIGDFHREQAASVARAEADLIARLSSIEGKLDRVSETLTRRDAMRLPLSSIANELNSCLPETRVLLAAASQLDNSAGIVENVKHLTITVDFSELYGYCWTPSSLSDAEGLFLQYIFSTSKHPLYLLPATIHEMYSVLARRFNSFLDYRAVRKRFLDNASRLVRDDRDGEATDPSDMSIEELELLACISSTSLGPYGRINELLQSGVVAPWPSGSIPLDDLPELRALALHVLGSIRPRWREADLVDAENLAVVALLNAQGEENTQATCHLSRARIMTQAAARLSGTSRVFDRLYVSGTPLILSPGSLAMYLHLLGLPALPTPACLLRVAGAAKSFALLREEMMKMLDRPHPADLISAAHEILSCRESLCGFASQVRRFHGSLSHVAEEPTPLGGFYRWDSRAVAREFDAAYERITTMLSDLLAYLEPLRESYAPFAKHAALPIHRETD